MRYLLLLTMSFLIASCSSKENLTLEKGNYRAKLDVLDKQVLPFIFEVVNDSVIKIYNANETIVVDEISYRNDSVIIQTPVFEGYLIAKISAKGLNGFYITEGLHHKVPFSASKGKVRFPVAHKNTTVNITGNWEMVFKPNSNDGSYIAKGIFEQQGNHVTGTIRTTTGDYRYLEGVVDGDSLKLSTFDGAHAFLFNIKITDDNLTGVFYSGNHDRQEFVGVKNESYEFPDAETLTFLNKGYSKFDFSFPNEKGEFISLSDEAYQNKVTVVQIMGTWCPNCLDESKYYSKFSKDNPDVKFIALAFEYSNTEALAFQRILRLKERIGIEYPIVLAQIGTKSKTEAQEKLPMLNHILSYPTTIFIDKKGVVRKIHTGFNGPATGQKYIDFTNSFETFIGKLLNE